MVMKGDQLPVTTHDRVKPSQKFTELVDAKLRECLSSKAISGASAPLADQLDGTTTDHIRSLALCAMRERTGADVALIQKRDLFGEFIGEDFTANEQEQKELIQQILDRVIWKGDLLTLLYVPGSALKKA